MGLVDWIDDGLVEMRCVRRVRSGTDRCGWMWIIRLLIG
jgi:hypothetical protein